VSSVSSSRGGRAGSRLLRLQLADGSAEAAAELLVARGSRLQRQLQEGHVLLLAGAAAVLGGLLRRVCCSARRE
jgi:hypothetical protein